MSKDELDELTRAGRAWRERHEPDQAETDAIAEQSKIEDSPKNPTSSVYRGRPAPAFVTDNDIIEQLKIPITALRRMSPLMGNTWNSGDG